VIKGLPFMNSAVVAALEQRKYQPAMAQGRPSTSITPSIFV